jgi:hypothetical protein
MLRRKRHEVYSANDPRQWDGVNPNNYGFYDGTGVKLVD